MFILKEWSVINMYDWVERSIVVSKSKELILQYCKKNTIGHVVDCSENNGYDLEQYCKEHNLDKYSIDIYYTITEIDCLS